MGECKKVGEISSRGKKTHLGVPRLKWDDNDKTDI
jgi:hypothetical protein